MTRIKYATVARSRGTNSLMVLRGKKTGQCGFLPPDDDDDKSIFGDPLYSERVVELPETMTPSEYDDYMEGLSEDDLDTPLAQAVEEVADEYDIDAGWFDDA